MTTVDREIRTYNWFSCGNVMDEFTTQGIPQMLLIKLYEHIIYFMECIGLHIL